ncbi:MAG: hypothetical protein HOB37_12510 [Rhodospirillaceae bacterium]|nr:hypothetical protein [Rhodospirillaceae bacterium]
MPRSALTLNELAKVRSDNRKILDADAGNQGTALGLKNYLPGGVRTGQPCIIVYVPYKLNEDMLDPRFRIPKLLTSSDGELEAPTDVVITTLPEIKGKKPDLSEQNKKLVAALRWEDGTLDHLRPGAQIGGYFFPKDAPAAASAAGDTEIQSYMGTVGYVVGETKGPAVGILTNQHIGIVAGQSIYIPGGKQPSVRVGITREVRQHYPDDEWLAGVDEPFAFIKTDAAFVSVEAHFRSKLRNELAEVGRIEGRYNVDLDTMDVIGLPVQKVGRTTGRTTGVIIAYGYRATHANDSLDRQMGKEPANIYTDFLISPDEGFEEFAAHGDSGSGILTNDGDKLLGLGLLWGGRPTDFDREEGYKTLAYGINLGRLLDVMGLDLILS